MWIYIARRVLAIPPLLLVISFLTFLLMQAAPGDYYKVLASTPGEEAFRPIGAGGCTLVKA